MAIDYFTNYGQSWLMEQKSSIGLTVTYSRGGDSVDITATLSRTEFEVISGDNSSSVIETHDFIIKPEDLVIGGTVTKPQPGDEITWTVDGEDRLYRVLDRPGLQNHRYDALRKALRIHTTLMTVQ